MTPTRLQSIRDAKIRRVAESIALFIYGRTLPEIMRTENGERTRQRIMTAAATIIDAMSDDS